MFARQTSQLFARVASASRSQVLRTSRAYESRLTAESFFKGHNLAATAKLNENENSGPYVVQDNTPPPFKVAPNVKVLGFKYPGAKAPDNKTFYAIAPRRPPMVLTGVAGSYVENLYKASTQHDCLMQTEEELRAFVLPLASDEEISRKFFSNTTIAKEEKKNAVAEFATQNKLSIISTALLNEVVDKDHSHLLPAIVTTYSELMARVRCEATAHITFGRIPTKNEVARVKQLLSDLRSPFQYYVHASMIVDPNIGGGVVLRIGDFELDGSLNTRCSEVQKFLVKSLQA
eukprot:c5203_g1_i1.p1 GENE.c5203_g1_i1~~c5203_g1_i1.p1  ORF type:complete len:302 (-),score=101.02 c5203_g1_i1:336-1202(-)